MTISEILISFVEFVLTSERRTATRTLGIKF
nr:MAG TPA: hypothetical protein [Caudoviricetes sp.]DAQ04176.1 MAG TPA: hypothetical protein [Caudoviricetes sp.]DAQ31438.1 MAG TPA: hypothetical protein [Caudoviricetes sp.]